MLPLREQRELLITAIADLLDGVRHVAVGASSPIPAAGAMLLRARNEASGKTPVRISILGSAQHNFFTNGTIEIFDCAAQGRIDAFFLGGGQIDGTAISIWSAPAAIRNRRCAGRAHLDRPTSIILSRASSCFARSIRHACWSRKSTSSAPPPRPLRCRAAAGPMRCSPTWRCLLSTGSVRGSRCAPRIPGFPPRISAAIRVLTMIRPMLCPRRQRLIPPRSAFCADGCSTSSVKPIPPSQILWCRPPEAAQLLPKVVLLRTGAAGVPGQGFATASWGFWFR